MSDLLFPVLFEKNPNVHSLIYVWGGGDGVGSNIKTTQLELSNLITQKLSSSSENSQPMSLQVFIFAQTCYKNLNTYSRLSVD